MSSSLRNVLNPSQNTAYMTLLHEKSKRRHRGFSTSHAGAFLAGMVVATMGLTLFHGSILHVTQSTDSFAENQFKVVPSPALEAPSDVHISLADEHHTTHEVAGLDCSAHGGPNSTQVTHELVYWKDLPLDNAFISPLKSTTERQYLTFEPDGGGWNNIRMSMETVLAMAVATGRVLVLPPSQHMYLLGKTSIDFGNFFPLEAIAKEHAGLEIISMKQFIEETDGKLHDLKTGLVSRPPEGRTDWDGDTGLVKSLLNPWLQSIAPNPDWNPEHCMAAFPKSTDPQDALELQRVFDEIQKSLPNVEDFINQPTPVNATVEERMREFVAQRQQLCLYTPELQKAQIIHFNGKRNMGGRLLVHFYAFLFFQDYQTDLWIKRFIRDHVRYIDDVQCAAARVIEAVRRHSKEKGNGGIYDAFHIRRGDFQYKKTRVDADEILEAAKEQIPKGATVYIGTDERKKEFFQVMADYWDVVFLDDFMNVLEGVQSNHYGMIDQLVTSRSRTFFGCWFSTFTGYINRLRGYHSQIEEQEGYEMGLLPTTYYYALKEHKTKMHDYWPVKKLYYAREYPVSWRNIDFDIQ